jgi:hypothetical protein
MHHDARRVIPHNGGWDGSQAIADVNGNPFTPSTTDFQWGGTLLQWGIGDPGLAPVRQGGSWLYAILPYVEQQAVFEERRWTVAVNVYICPSRRAAESYPVALQDGEELGGGASRRGPVRDGGRFGAWNRL